MGASAVGPVDFGYLERFMAGDVGVTLEVLALFVQQAEVWSETLEREPASWRETVHTIKGAARGVGANALGDACERAESEDLGDLAQVRAQLAAALAAIETYRVEKGG